MDDTLQVVDIKSQLYIMSHTVVSKDELLLVIVVTVDSVVCCDISRDSSVVAVVRVVIVVVTIILTLCLVDVNIQWGRFPIPLFWWHCVMRHRK